LHCPQIKSTPRFCLSTRRGAAEFWPLLPFRDGGDPPFSRYENGKTKPLLVLVKLLRVLDRHPDLLDEIKTAQHRMGGDGSTSALSQVRKSGAGAPGWCYQSGAGSRCLLRLLDTIPNGLKLLPDCIDRIVLLKAIEFFLRDPAHRPSHVGN
jgi:hypothetical protein